MPERKYERFVIQKPVATGGYGPEFVYTGDLEYNSNFTIMFLRITEPALMEDYPHFHDFDMYLYFMSFDPDNMGELGADIELGLGKERELYRITVPTTVYIPAGMVHLPARVQARGQADIVRPLHAGFEVRQGRKQDYPRLTAHLRGYSFAENGAASSPASGMPRTVSPLPSSRTS